jgi:hypothetical protein
MRETLENKNYSCQKMECKCEAIPVIGHEGVRLQGCYIFYTVGSQMAVRLSALCASRPLPLRKIPGTHFC